MSDLMAQYPTPDQCMPELFKAVQSRPLFPDSKLFVDAVPLHAAAEIEAKFVAQCHAPDFDLLVFVQKNFALPTERLMANSAPVAPQSAAEYVQALWPILRRPADVRRAGDSLIALPHSYIVPGGRFREIYYWDSYFTLLGLAASGQWQSVRDMVANFAYLIDTLGHIPNGNRTYYLSRSQPPLFAHMVQMLAEAFPEEGWLQKYLPAMAREYAFWMQGEAELARGSGAHRRLVRHPKALLNRYWDDADQPRQESFAEDMELAAHCASDARSLFRNVRAACETGWDFSSRWFEHANQLHTVRTTSVVPIDLNCIMVGVEQILAAAYTQVGDAEQAAHLRTRAERRADVIRTHFYCAQRRQFVDCLLPDFRHSDKTSLATSWPLFANIATPDQAGAVCQTLSQDFLRPGGWVTTGLHTGQQWDAPNGWAPLQWVTFQGLRNYGFDAAAVAGGQRWIANNLACYKTTGLFFEKYDVEQPGRLASGGEYPVQQGFGWTNAVFLVMQQALAELE